MQADAYAFRHKAIREAMRNMDVTAFTKIEVSVPDANALMG